VRIIANDIPKTARERYKQITNRAKKMKTLSFVQKVRVLKVTSVCAAVLGLLFLAAPAAFASAEDHVSDGITVSQTWMNQIDQGQYDESYAAASGEMHDKVPQDRWALILKTLRAPWGPVVNRQQLSHVYKPNGFEGAEGEFLVITYNTSFQKMDAAKEVVVLRWEDGKWRAAGYNAGPVGNPDANADAPNNTTEVQTQQHVKPLPQ
jgi:hypothetical protein